MLIRLKLTMRRIIQNVLSQRSLFKSTFKDLTRVKESGLSKFENPQERRLFSTSSPKLPDRTTRVRFFSGWPRFLALSTLIAVPAASASVWIVSGEDPQKRAKLLFIVPLRLWRDISTAGCMIADYQFSLKGLPLGSLERMKAKHECHVRCADRLQLLCFTNGGIYIKLGQHIAQLDHLLPAEYVEAMRRSMLNKCPESSYTQVCQVFLAELGKLPNEVFAEFNQKPLASASLAQVHEAKLKNGQKVAVKVQHAHLTDTAEADMETVRLVVTAVHLMFPSFDYRWLIDEVDESLPKELNFILEAQNAEKCAANFAKSPKLSHRVVVPKIFWNLTRKRVLTMDFMEGEGVSDVEAIKKLGLKPADVAKLVSETFAEMIFHHGFVHCDPHAANMKVQAVPSRGYGLFGRSPQAQLVLLDHGLYRTLTSNIKTNYAELWKALVLADVDKIKKHSVAMGAGEDLYMLFAAVLTMRPWDRILDPTHDHLQVPDTEEERAQLQMYAAQYVGEVAELLRRLPRVVLLLLKTNDCLRSVDNALGAPVNTFIIIARECTRALAQMEIEAKKGLWNRLRCIVEIYRVELRLWAFQISALFASWGRG